jgi:RNA polymerase sigma-70 factor (ECF subfamily)
MPAFHAVRGAPLTATAKPSFESLYDDYARFVWRALVRLGVASADVEDVVQEVFLVIHRRLDDFREESSVRTWVYGIAVHVARNYRRTGARRHLGQHASQDADGSEHDQLPETAERAPDALLARAEAAELLVQLLQELDQDSREVFVLAELEEMTAVEIGEVLHLNPNTVSSRLRLARRAFDQAVRRNRARDQWRTR